MPAICKLAQSSNFVGHGELHGITVRKIHLHRKVEPANKARGGEVNKNHDQRVTMAKSPTLPPQKRGEIPGQQVGERVSTPFYLH